MPKEVEIIEGRRGLENDPLKRKFDIVLVRHGRPVEYASEHSSLAQEASESISSLAKVIFWTSSGSNIRVLHSGRERAAETANIMRKTFKELAFMFPDSDVEVKSMRNAKFLEPGETLTPLERAGVPKEKLYEIWMSKPYQWLVDNGSTPPEDVFGRILDFLTVLNSRKKSVSESRNMTYLCVTHETILGSIFKMVYNQDSDWGVNYGETVRMITGFKDNKVALFAKERRYALKLK